MQVPTMINYLSYNMLYNIILILPWYETRKNNNLLLINKFCQCFDLCNKFT